jgi:DNA-binding transcriptional ArsR family regulator
MARPRSPETELARVLTHPLRPRILELLNARGEASPNQMANELGVPVGTISYHTRLLRNIGWIELVRTEPRRGAVEHFYRAAVRPVVEDEQWETLPIGVRRRLAGLTIGQILRAAVSAADAGGFDRAHAHAVRLPLELDEQGWRELSAVLTHASDEAIRIQERCNERRKGVSTDEPERSELAILHFEGPWKNF